MRRQSTVAAPPQSSRLTLRKRRETFCFSPLESREVHERRGREEPFGDAASIDCSSASPVVPPTLRKRRETSQAEGWVN